jgi:uncharacterized protein YfcZ (UPF0381/DUF406 family)
MCNVAYFEQFRVQLVEEAKHLSSDVLSPSLIVIHDASRCCQDDVTKLRENSDNGSDIRRLYSNKEDLTEKSCHLVDTRLTLTQVRGPCTSVTKPHIQAIHQIYQIQSG